MIKLAIMQTAVLETFGLISLIAGFLVQGTAAFVLFRMSRKAPEKFGSPFFFRFSVLFTGLLALSGIIAICIPSLSVYSVGILLASCILLVSVIQFSAYVPQPQAPEPSEPMEEVPPEENQADRIVKIGQEFLSRVSEAFSGEVNLVRLLDFINETITKETAADGGVVFLTDDFEDIINAKSYTGKFPPPYKLPQDLPHKPVRVETNFRYAQFNLGESIFGEVAASGKPVFIEKGDQDSRIYVNGPEEFLKPGSYIFVPLMLKDRVVGVAGSARLPESTPFTAEEFEIAKVLAQYAGSSINTVYSIQEILEHADLEREASIATQIQKTLHPKRLPELPEISFGSFFNGTKGVCGDYFDIILARRDRIGIAIADVAGKGIQSSMVMIMLRSILHLVTNTTKDAGTILDWVNKGITGKIDMDHYATLSYLSYCPNEHSIEYATAGHQPMLLWRADKKAVENVHQKTDPIGVERSSVYSNMKLTVSPGDIIILYTDGLIEALNQEGRQYGLESLSRVISKNNSLSAKELASEVKHDIQAFVGSASLHDDQTLVIMKIKA